MSNQQYTQMDIYFDNYSPGREKVGEKEKGRDWERQRDRDGKETEVRQKWMGRDRVTEIGREAEERQSERKRRERRRGK